MKKPIWKLEDLATDEMLFADGLEKALIGVVYRFGQDPISCYDIDAIIDILVTRDGMSPEDAEEFYEYNIIGGWVGDTTPCFIRRCKPVKTTDMSKPYIEIEIDPDEDQP
jgi:ribosome biogenesis SPOUT family RNA methylase Rps3